jgi:hypothetical protein
MKFAGVLALVGAAANLLLGSIIFQSGFAGARWCLFGTLEPDTLDPLIPLLYEIGASACGIAAGLVLLLSRGPAVPVACATLIAAGFALLVPRNIYGNPYFGQLAEDYARYGPLLIFVGLVGATLPGVIGLVALVRKRVFAKRHRAAAA